MSALACRPFTLFVTYASLIAAPSMLVADDTFVGTAPLNIEGDIASLMIDELDAFLLRETGAAMARRARHWRRDTTSAAAYETSIEPNRDRFKKSVGIQEERLATAALQLVASTSAPARLASGPGYEIVAVRWPVFHGVHGEGLLLRPTDRQPVAHVVAIPDAAQTPEMIAGIAPGIAPESQFAARLAAIGCVVVVPTLIDRGDEFSTMSADLVTFDPSVGRKIDLTHREFIYRAAFEMGRHVIGYEIQKVLAAVDWFENRDAALPRLVVGYGEGGLLALYAAAIDRRIAVAGVSGYFESRQELWREPLDRNVFGLLDEFGDAEIASLIAPRALVVEASRGPEFAIEPQKSRGGPGRLRTPPLSSVRAELERARRLVGALKPRPALELVVSGDGTGAFGSIEFLQRVLELAGVQEKPPESSPAARVVRSIDTARRQQRQVLELDAFSQFLLRESEGRRDAFWSRADRKSRSVEKWLESVEFYRRYLYDEVIGRFAQSLTDPKPRTRKIFATSAFTGYQVVLDCFPGVFAYGILLVPNDVRSGDRRPVVVCQHGLEGRPRDAADPSIESPYYHQYACRLAERGFITYAPQNIYIFGDRFRTLQRKANPLKKTLFSIMVPQHQQLVNWLATLPIVDPERIAFYGLSYGGKTAMRVPPLVDGYCLSICSADFNEWIWKNVSTRSRYSYVGTGEYEIFEFDLGNTFNYAELAGLIAPRPFMVERGHHDGVAPDTQVAYEFARVRRLYTDLRIPERTEIEFFDGPHTIHGVRTFEFLHNHLRWPRPTGRE